MNTGPALVSIMRQGSYLVAPVGEGWVASVDLPASTLNPLPGVEGVLAEAGARDVRLVVARFAYVAMQLVDARTTEPIDAPWATATLRVDANQDGTYDIVADWWGVETTKGVSEDEFKDTLSQKYQYHNVKQACEEKGYAVEEEVNEEDGSIRLVVRKWGAE